MARPMRVEGTEFAGLASILDADVDGRHEPADTGKEQFRIADGGLDLKGCDAEIVKVRRMAQIAEDEYGTQGHEQGPHQQVRVRR